MLRRRIGPRLPPRRLAEGANSGTTRVLKNEAPSASPPPQEEKLNLGDTPRPPAEGPFGYAQDMLRPSALPLFQHPDSC